MWKLSKTNYPKQKNQSKILIVWDKLCNLSIHGQTKFCFGQKTFGYRFRMANIWIISASVQTNRGYKKPNRNRNNQIHYSVWYEGNRIFQNSIPIPFNRIGIPVFWIRFKRKGILNFNRIIRFNRIIQFLTEF